MRWSYSQFYLYAVAENFNQPTDPLIQALQYRCSETERREQEALLYIKDCLKLVEQTQHEKEQLVIQVQELYFLLSHLI